MTAGPPPPSAATPPGSTGARRSTWVLPAVMFVVGAVLGAVVLWAATRSAGPSVATPTVTQTVTATGPRSSPTGGVATLTVPAQCLRVAEDSRVVGDLIDRAVAAARDLDAARLSDLVRQIQGAQETLRRDAASCRGATASLPPAPAPTSTPALTPAAPTTP